MDTKIQRIKGAKFPALLVRSNILPDFWLSVRDSLFKLLVGFSVVLQNNENYSSLQEVKTVMIFSWWDEMHKDAEGLALLKDWLGEGGQPVSHELAERRATICSTCSLNTAPNWWEKVKEAIAQTIVKQLEWKNRIGLRTSLDDTLHLCSACGCCCRLKVFVPTKHIAGHTPESTYSKFPVFCWVKKELDALSDKTRIQPSV